MKNKNGLTYTQIVAVAMATECTFFNKLGALVVAGGIVELIINPIKIKNQYA